MRKNEGKILVVDDNEGIRSALGILLPMHFGDVELISSPKSLMSSISRFRPDAVLLDMNFNRDMNTGNEGLFWLSEIRSHYRNLPVILFTAYADIALAVEGMKRGAFDFIVKPWDNEHLVSVLEKAVRSVSRQTGNAGRPETNVMRWGNGVKMLGIRHMVERIAPTEATVLITGENGTGKDLLANEIHRLSSRSSGPMVCVDMGAVTDTLFESELFGHVKGAFTDAKSDHKGKFEQAEGGTLFLDEIGNIPLHMQAKLLRAIQNRTVTRVGGTEPVHVDIRLICATNMDLPAMVAGGRFREDLYYRINTAEICLPPLRERKDEIIPLAELFLAEFASKYGREADGFTDEAIDAMMRCRWGGNIRELRNVVERAVIISDGKNIGTEELSVSASADDDMEENGSLEEMEEKLIRSTMKKHEGNLSMVARSLGISRPTLYGKLKKYNI